jgi:hypothetical protein
MLAETLSRNNKRVLSCRFLLHIGYWLGDSASLSVVIVVVELVPYKYIGSRSSTVTVCICMGYVDSKILMSLSSLRTSFSYVPSIWRRSTLALEQDSSVDSSRGGPLWLPWCAWWQVCRRRFIDNDPRISKNLRFRALFGAENSSERRKDAQNLKVTKTISENESENTKNKRTPKTSNK